MHMAHGLSTQSESVEAAAQACDAALSRMNGAGVDLATVFFTPQHVDHAEAVVREIAQRTKPGAMVGISAVGVIGGGREIERGPGMSVLLSSLPGVRVRTFDVEDFPPLDNHDRTDDWANALHAGHDLRFALLLVDPYSIPINQMIPHANKALKSRVRPPSPNAPARAGGPVLFGGLASASSKAGGNVLVHNGTVMRTGAVGVSLSGSGLHVDTVVSQGCRPFGPPMIVTRAKANMIFELSGKPAVAAIQEAVETLGDDPRESLKGGLFLGLAIDEYKERFGRNDFLIRGVVGVDQERGAVAVADLVRVGRTVRLHTRDAKTADEDLALLLDAQKLYDPPFGSICITCFARGERLFGTRHHDASAVVRAFRAPGGEPPAGGQYLDPAEQAPIAQSGFFGTGEIGPIGGVGFHHSNTACVALFREG
jgi:small ligand-binding sensory domain FIST